MLQKLASVHTVKHRISAHCPKMNDLKDSCTRHDASGKLIDYITSANDNQATDDTYRSYRPQ